jgi:hypothetical protein
VHVLGPVQLPPLPHVWLHTGVEQAVSVQPGAHAHVSGATQLPPCSQRCTHVAAVQSSPE